MIRESDYFLDRYIADNFWQMLMGIVAALVIVYTYRNRRRFRIAWLRMWPSPGLTLLFAGAVIIFAFVRLVGHETLWMAILGDGYQRIVKLAVEEFIELIGYFLWLIGTIEYTYQARAIAMREPQPVAIAVSINNHQRSDDAHQHLPEIVSDVSIQKVIRFPNHERERHAAEQERDGPLRRTVLCDPRIK